MERLKLIKFVAGHTTELQGLRTALIGAIFVAMALWQAAPVWTNSGTSFAAHRTSWLPLILIGWHFDERLATYYRQCVGDVVLHRPYSRLIRLMAIGVVYITLRFWELAASLQFGLAALFIAAVHAHIALLSGEQYRRYYGLGAVVWCALSIVPSTPLANVFPGSTTLAVGGLTCIFLGWRDHVTLVRALGPRTNV